MGTCVLKYKERRGEDEMVREQESEEYINPDDQQSLEVPT
jgi:hypothetical protein